MSHLFTSGVFTNNRAAWHRLGEVVDGNLSPSEAFSRANALFTVEKRSLHLHSPAMYDDLVHCETADDARAIHKMYAPPIDLGQAIVRTDNNQPLGIVSPGYEVIQNDKLLDLANALREDTTIDNVIVLKGGARVCFTARINGADKDIIKGDKVFKYFVGYLGHDGKTSFSGGFGMTRVVCQNTLSMFQQEQQRNGANKSFTIRHCDGQIRYLDRIIETIDLARQTMDSDIEAFKRMQSTPMNYELFRHYLENVYASSIPNKVKENGKEREGTIQDLPRKYKALEEAYAHGKGMDIPGVRGTLWQGYNAITEVESSYGGNKISAFNSAHFGSGASIIKKATEEAMLLAV